VPDLTSGDSYEGTRAAWRAIWERAEIERELGTRQYPRARHIRNLFIQHLPANQPILEAGCGLGAELIGLADGGFSAIGVDYVTEAVGRLKRHRPALALAAGDVHALPFRGGVFGAYLSFGVLEHFASGPRAALREAFRVLRPRGTLVVTVPAPNLVWRLARLRRRALGRGELAQGYYETAFSATDLAAHVASEGFEIVERHSVGHDFTFWGLGRAFRGAGYYETNRLALGLGTMSAHLFPRSMSFATLLIARKRTAAA